MNQNELKTVLVVGASDKPDRYSHRALMMLKERDYHVVGIHPFLRCAEGVDVYPSIEEVPTGIKQSIHTVTMYVNEAVSSQMEESLRKLAPQRIIWNPGSENTSVMNNLGDSKISQLSACTLVLLSTGQF